MKQRNTKRLIAYVMENMADEAIRILRSGFFDEKVLVLSQKVKCLMQKVMKRELQRWMKEILNFFLKLQHIANLKTR